MPVVFYVIAVILAAAGLGMILSAACDEYNRRRRSDLTERLLPYQPSVADEAEVWLARQ